jgi:hypothetical protein
MSHQGRNGDTALDRTAEILTRGRLQNLATGSKIGRRDRYPVKIPCQLSWAKSGRPSEPASETGAIMIILGLFLIHLAEAAGAFVFIEWLVRWFGGATVTESALLFAAVIGAVAALLVLITHQRGGLIIAAAIIAFWSVAIFGASGQTAVNIIAVAFAVLAVAAAVVLAESVMGSRRASASRRE